MKINYNLSADDFLVFQLYANTKSKISVKNRKNSRFYVSAFYLLAGLYFIINNFNSLFGYIFVIIGILWFIFYPKYAKNKTKKYFKSHIKENYSNRINEKTELDFQNEFIISTDSKSESKILLKELKKLIELENHYLIQLSNIESFIIPKRAIIDNSSFKQKMNNLNIEYIDDTKWKWN